ncbi:MAG: IPExxxVDY family protein [Flavobacteriales bacterium Tduv]
MSKESFPEEECDFDFSLIGIISYLEEYKLAYFFNRSLHLNFIQDVTGLDYFDKPTNQHLYFPFFKCESLEQQAKYTLIKNKVDLIQETYLSEDMLLKKHKIQSYLLIPEQKHFHYFLIIKDMTNQEENLTKRLNHFTFIIHTTNIDVHSLKSKYNLIL